VSLFPASEITNLLYCVMDIRGILITAQQVICKLNFNYFEVC